MPSENYSGRRKWARIKRTPWLELPMRRINQRIAQAVRTWAQIEGEEQREDRDRDRDAA